MTEENATCIYYLVCPIGGIVHGEDEMYFNDSENDVGMTIFRCDGVYLAYLDNQKSGSVSI